MIDREYQRWEYEHDKARLERLENATVGEEETDTGLLISYGGLTGYVTFCDGHMSWECMGIFKGKPMPVDQEDIDRSAVRLTNYGRRCVTARLKRVAKNEIEATKQRLKMWKGE